MQTRFIKRLKLDRFGGLWTLAAAGSTVFMLVASAAFSQGLAESLEEVEPNASPGFDGAQWLDGDFSVAELDGKVVLVNFWATWCPPCVEELPSIASLWATHSRQDFEVVAVNAGENRNDVDAFLFEWQLDDQFPVVLDTNLEIYRNWNVQPLPTTFLLDRTGRFRYRALGGRNFSSENIQSIVDALINE